MKDSITAQIFGRAYQHACEFRDAVSDRVPRPIISPEALCAAFDGPTPEVSEDPVAVIDALNAAAVPGLTGSVGPRFFGWVIGASQPVGVAADMLTSVWGQNAALYACSPAAAMAEKVAARWLLDILRLPGESSVGFVTGATMASFVCLAAARTAVLARVGWDVETDGLVGAPAVRLFVGQDTHVTILAALRYLGFGNRATRVPCDSQGRMDAAALSALLSEGGGPAIVVAQAGQINTGAFDPAGAIANACRRHGAWLHVDGAFGLWARLVPEMNELTVGLEQADSWSTDGHKWLQLPYDSGFAIVRDASAHRRAMAMSASYLPPANEGEYDPGQFVPELSRRARGFPVWAQLRAMGRQGLTNLVRTHCALARRLAQRLAAEKGVQVINEVVLNQIIVRFGTGSVDECDALTRATVAQLQTDNICLAGGADWRGLSVLRVSVIAAPLTEADIDRLAAAVLAAWRRVQA
ncbi:MAG: aspartate aminotransferase family protein [Proteobacteria bacterium]|nr:aspartate aminotransferase family protein [Pseudomonadota bacterium]